MTFYKNNFIKEKSRHVIERYFDSLKSLGITAESSKGEFRT